MHQLHRSEEMTAEQQAEAIARAAELSADRIASSFGLGAMNGCKIRAEIERTMAESLKFKQDCQSAFKDQRIAEMARILDWIPHNGACPPSRCDPDCAACAWERLKGNEIPETCRLKAHNDQLQALVDKQWSIIEKALKVLDQYLVVPEGAEVKKEVEALKKP